MKKIVTVIKPFTLNQNVYVYEDNEIIDVNQVKLSDLQDTIVTMANEYEANDVTLVGAKKFSAGIKNKIKEVEMAKYNGNKLNIEVRAN
jgi:hypothetical protein